jgi:hypothetical protein
MELETLLSQGGIHSNDHFKEWLENFTKIYGDTETNLRLYIHYALIYFIGLLFVSRFILDESSTWLKHDLSLKKLKFLEDRIRNTFKKHNIVEFEYFTPIFLLSEEKDLTFLSNVISDITSYLFDLKINPVFIFDYLFQKIISPIFRHKAGEYYTPPFLVEKMVSETYSFGEKILDPCCGSGNFLVGIILKILSYDTHKAEKIIAINNVWGFDINPISIYLTKVNVLFLVKDINTEVKFNLYVVDFLFHERSELKSKFDLIIGNPPWYTYRDVESISYQEALKNLAEQLEIKPRPKNILNLEVSTLFFYKANKDYMKNKAKIFFVITKGVITGSHASRFRNFKDFSDIKIWLFDKKVEKIFNIDFICLYAQKSLHLRENVLYEVPTYHFALTHDDIEINNYNKLYLKLIKEGVFVPFSIEQKGKKVFIKKLIPLEKKGDLLPLGESYYKKLFHKGADLNPRNLIFVKEHKLNDSLVKINTDERIFKKSKTPWNKREFADEIIEKKYLFKVVKSTELVKFYVYNSYNVFLPLSKNDLSFNYNNLDKNSKVFYDKINMIYLKYKKVTTTHKSLMENLNRWSKLITSRQLSKIKVVYNNSGSIVNSAVIQGDYLITGDLSFFDTANLNEAYYLSAVLNSNLLTEQIKIMKSSRHIFKLPFNISIKKYDAVNYNHQQLVKLGKEGQNIVISVFKKTLEKNGGNYSKFKIQNILVQELKVILNHINKLVLKEFNLKET